MRARGGGVADIAVLVVAADDGVQPQTLESIRIIQEEELPFLVAINKIDKPEADIDRVKKGLAEINLTPEDWGGKTVCVPVSAKTKQGLDDLLEMILLLADLEKDRLLSDPNQKAVGTVIEAYLDKGEGPVAAVLIQAGTLKPKDLVITGGHYGGVEGKIKMLKDFNGQIIKKAKPGMPVRVLGLKKTPKVGDILQGLENIKDLKERIKEKKSSLIETKAQVISSQEEKKALNIIIRTDVLGSQEAICQALEKIKHFEVGINIIKKGLGNILEADVLQAEAVNKEGGKVYLIGFHVTASPQVNLLAKEKNIAIKIYKVIYELIDDVKKALQELLEPERIRVDLAELEVIAFFRKQSSYQIVGTKVKQGLVSKGALVEIWRKKEKINSGKITQLQITKKDVKEAKEGLEVGLKIEGQGLDVQIGDVLKVYREEERERTLE
jgi:translation initiation factor IF-2